MEISVDEVIRSEEQFINPIHNYHPIATDRRVNKTCE